MGVSDVVKVGDQQGTRSLGTIIVFVGGGRRLRLERRARRGMRALVNMFRWFGWLYIWECFWQGRI